MREDARGLKIVAVAALMSMIPALAECKTIRRGVAMADDVTKLVQGGNRFAFRLYHRLPEKGNAIYSPYSISEALAMVYAGARGETRAAMGRTLQYDVDPSMLPAAFRTLDEQVRAAKEFKLAIANGLWVEKNYVLRPEYLATVKDNYRAEIRSLDFVHQFEAARATINDWISRETQGKIRDLLARGTVDPMTRLVLTNAIYFKASWTSPFDKRATREDNFTLADGKPIRVPMMNHSVEYMDYTRADGYQALRMPYEGGKAAMILILPEKGQFAAVEKVLSGDVAVKLARSLRSQRVALAMPRFTYESRFDLNRALGAMGMAVAFSAGADFSGIEPKRELYISNVIHGAYIKTDEVGTEAAAATAITMRATAMRNEAEPVRFIVDRPFFFLIQDLETGSVLFIGRVVDPRG